jgi:hypothetical protein
VTPADLVAPAAALVAAACVVGAYALGLRQGRAEVSRWLGRQPPSRLADLARTVNQPSVPPPAARPSKDTTR